jgi:hypothetical protein
MRARKRRCSPLGEMSQSSLCPCGVASLQSGITSMIASPLIVHPCAVEGGAFSRLRSPVTRRGVPPRAGTKKANGTSHSAVHCARSVSPERNPPLQWPAGPLDG